MEGEGLKADVVIHAPSGDTFTLHGVVLEIDAPPIESTMYEDVEGNIVVEELPQTRATRVTVEITESRVRRTFRFLPEPEDVDA